MVVRTNTTSAGSSLVWLGLALTAIVWLCSVQVGLAAISQGLRTETTSFQAGELVSLAGNDSGVGVSATPSNVSRLFGVAADKPLVQLSGDGNLSVVISGSTPVLVSDINGAIAEGDPITASPLSGIGMKATTSTQIVGTALSSLKDNITGQQTVTDKSDATRTVNIGLISVQVAVSYYVAPESSNLLPGFMRNLATSVAGRPVSPLRTIAGIVLFLAGMTAACVILYASTRSSLTSIGRNPLATPNIRKGMTQVIITATGVILASLLGTYLVLIF